jgi:hypothetical protein
MIGPDAKKAVAGMDEDIDWDKILEDVPAPPGWLRMDEREDAIVAIEHAADTALTVAEKPLNWKWVIISTHNALQGALVCTLSGTAGFGALKKQSRKEMLRWYEAFRSDPNAPYPEDWLEAPLTLYGWAKDASRMGDLGGSPLRTTAGQDDDVKFLNELRRDFMHFTPKSWSLEEAGLPRMVLNAADIVRQLLLQHPVNACRLDDDQKARVEGAIGRLRSTLEPHDG